MEMATEAVKPLKERQIDQSWAEAADRGAKIWRGTLTSGTLAALEMWKSSGISTTIVLDNFIKAKDFQSQLPPTPVDRGLIATEQKMRWADVLLLGLMKLVNMWPTAIHAENGGHLVRNVIASQSKTDKQSSHGSRLPFSWHSDQLNCNLARKPIEAACPDTLCFFVVRNSEKVNTRIVANEEILDHLKYKSVRLLREAYFTIDKPESNDQINDQLFPILSNVPVIINNGDGTNFIRYDPQAVKLTNKANKEHLSALRDLETVLGKLKIEPIVFRPGQFVIFKNRKVMHSREAFEPLSDLRKSRWLRRIYGVDTDLP